MGQGATHTRGTLCEVGGPSIGDVSNAWPTTPVLVVQGGSKRHDLRLDGALCTQVADNQIAVQWQLEPAVGKDPGSSLYITQAAVEAVAKQGKVRVSGQTPSCQAFSATKADPPPPDFLTCSLAPEAFEGDIDAAKSCAFFTHPCAHSSCMRKCSSGLDQHSAPDGVRTHTHTHSTPARTHARTHTHTHTHKLPSTLNASFSQVAVLEVPHSLAPGALPSLKAGRHTKGGLYVMAAAPGVLSEVLDRDPNATDLSSAALGSAIKVRAQAGAGTRMERGEGHAEGRVHEVRFVHTVAATQSVWKAEEHAGMRAHMHTHMHTHRHTHTQTHTRARACRWPPAPACTTCWTLRPPPSTSCWPPCSPRSAPTCPPSSTRRTAPWWWPAPLARASACCCSACSRSCRTALCRPPSRPRARRPTQSWTAGRRWCVPLAAWRGAGCVCIDRCPQAAAGLPGCSVLTSSARPRARQPTPKSEADGRPRMAP